ncbi:MAG: hypothetical protein R6U98_33440, partial [Pirellulaceae bacterium]
RNAAISWALDHPRQVLWLMGRKFLRMWSPWPNDEAFQTGWLGTMVMLGYVPLVLLSLVGTGIWGWRGWPLAICVFPAIYYTGLHMVFVGSIRYRQPAMLAWLILAAAVIVIYGARMSWFAASPTNGRTACVGPLSTRPNPTA